MTEQAAVYDIPERTGTLKRASIDAVCERILDRAATP
jgi:hypothetical protein